MQETRQLSGQEAHDFLNDRITTLEEAVLSQKIRSDVHKAFLAVLVVTIDNPEKLQKVWEVFSSNYEEITMAQFDAPKKDQEEKLRADIQESIKSWSEVVNEAVELKKP
ncbi:hypothetical protein [Serratia plymuthica]|uniref:hypothetical protein n=1 Tax=Serratia plymuthica TaxID=82996 RepID=UPI000935E104|nr:hypothetical protein [Serratia plymuthica]OJT38446.1 hypothetical protein BSR04_18425 [Serratia plymuthica]